VSWHTWGNTRRVQSGGSYGGCDSAFDGLATSHPSSPDRPSAPRTARPWTCTSRSRGRRRRYPPPRQSSTRTHTAARPNTDPLVGTAHQHTSPPRSAGAAPSSAGRQCGHLDDPSTLTLEGMGESVFNILSHLDDFLVVFLELPRQSENLHRRSPNQTLLSRKMSGVQGPEGVHCLETTVSASEGRVLPPAEFVPMPQPLGKDRCPAQTRQSLRSEPAFPMRGLVGRGPHLIITDRTPTIGIRCWWWGVRG
jgi:hypothetical protein